MVKVNNITKNDQLLNNFQLKLTTPDVSVDGKRTSSYDCRNFCVILPFSTVKRILQKIEVYCYCSYGLFSKKFGNALTLLKFGPSDALFLIFYIKLLFFSETF